MPNIDTRSWIIKDCENWLRLAAFVDFVARKLFYEILHTKENLPLDGSVLYCELQKHKSKLHFQIHKEVLCPSSEIIDESQFDFLTYITVIRLMFGRKYKNLLRNVMFMRKKVFDMTDVSIDKVEFNQLWDEIFFMLEMFWREGFDIPFPMDLKTCDLVSIKESTGISFLIIIAY